MACAYCVSRQQIVDFQQLHIGDHVEFGRASVIKTFLSSLDLCPSTLEHLRFGYLYFHHAIITEINHSKRKIKLVEFTTVETSLTTFLRSLRKATITESVMNFDDNHRDMNMFLVIHKNRGYDPPRPQEIVRNARRLLQEAKSERYNLLINNCEHLANLCVTEHRVSLQILQIKNDTHQVLQKLLKARPSWFRKLVGTISRKLLFLMMKLESMFKSFKNQTLMTVYENIKRFIGKWMAGSSMIAVTFLAVDIYQFYAACKDDGICENCFDSWLYKMFWR